jgi:hypothetical protein
MGRAHAVRVSVKNSRVKNRIQKVAGGGGVGGFFFDASA